MEKKRALTNTVMKRIREMMKQNKHKREVTMHKQQLKIIDIHEKLLDKGFKIGYTAVRNFVTCCLVNALLNHLVYDCLRYYLTPVPSPR